MVPDVVIRPVQSWWDRRRFIGFPYDLYRSSQMWVAPLRGDQAQLIDRRRNPFFERADMKLFLALDGQGRVAGRIAAILNHGHLERHADSTGFFGFFECIERYDVAKALLDAAAAWLRECDLTRMRGPVNPSLNATAGLLIDGFDRPPVVMMPYNPPYYEDYLEQYGLLPVKVMWSYYADLRHLDRDRLTRGADIALRRTPGLSLRSLDMSRYEAEAETLNRLYNATFPSVWGYVPMSRAEFLHMARAMRKILDPGLVLFLEHEGETVGYSLSIPDVNELLRYLPSGRLLPLGFLILLVRSRLQQLRQARYILIGLLPRYQRRGLDVLMAKASMDAGLRGGYRAAEFGWVMDDNTVLRNAIEAYGCVVDKRYAIYDIDL
jgi:hypothetical protein